MLALLALLGVLLFPMLEELWPFDIPVSEPVRWNTTSPPNDRPAAFSPDDKTFAYVWRTGARRRAGRRYMTLTDALELRWHPTEQPDQVHAVKLDALDSRASGGAAYNLEAHVAFSPDSARLAAVCAKCAVVVDLATGQSRRFEYPGEWFNALRWLSAHEITFSTTSHKGEGEADYWRLDLSKPGAARREVRRTGATFVREAGGRPVGLQDIRWSPGGRYVCDDGLLDISTGKLRPLPVAPDRVYWQPGDSALLIHQEVSENGKVLLVDTATGAVRDLSKPLRNAAGPQYQVRMHIEGWTADGRLIVCYAENYLPEGSNVKLEQTKGYLVQPLPFAKVMEKEVILRPSPVPGWVLVQGGDTMTWTDYAGVRTAPIDGWPNDWTWSRDGRWAAVVEDKAVRVFRPRLPE